MITCPECGRVFDGVNEEKELKVHIKYCHPQKHPQKGGSADVCPECGAQVMHQEGCQLCPVCGWGKCG
jgi:ribosomal protein L34E